MELPTKLMSWGLALSGGGANGLANAGVLKALEEQHLKPDYIAGSSMGALVAALHATGHPTSVFDDLASKLSLRSVLRLKKIPFRHGLHSGLVQHQVRKFLQPLLGNATIGDCTTPFVCLAGKVKHPIKWSKVLKPNFTEYFLSSFQHHVFPPETNIIDAVTASSAVPVIFNPYKIEAQEFIDVIYFGAIPIEFLQEAYKPDVIIATDTNPYYNNIYKRLPQHVHTFIKDGYQSIEQSKKLANLCLWPKSIAGIHRFDKTKDFMETGHQEATKNLAEILQLVGK